MPPPNKEEVLQLVGLLQKVLAGANVIGAQMGGPPRPQTHQVLVTNPKSGKKDIVAQVNYPQLISDLNEGLNDLICVGEDVCELLDELLEQRDAKPRSKKRKRKSANRVKAT